MTALPALKLDPPQLRDHADVTRGMEDRHRRVYALLIGFDPDQQIYTYAKSRAQADAIMRFHASYARKIIAALDAQEAAARAAFGESESREVQEVLFDGRAVLRAHSPWRA